MINKRYLFNKNKCIIKQLLNSVFAICKIIKVSVKAMLHGAIFLATCNAILLLRDVN
jgi:hypothetical protein